MNADCLWHCLALGQKFPSLAEIMFVVVVTVCRRQVRYRGTPRNVYRHIIMSGQCL